ncbi:adenylate kinase-domain-containing protein [Blastocladiella britannica]|nr:adenylate kinase-domain-containing protein [Blastocladiella britannica]
MFARSSSRALFATARRNAAVPTATLRRTMASEASSSSGSSSKWLIGAAALASAGGVYLYLDSSKTKKVHIITANAKAGLPAGSKFATKPTVIFVLGGPGAGKGTQCARLVDDYDFVHLSAGDLLRDERNRAGSQVGELINSYIKEGKIVPMEITISLLEAAMLASGKDRFLIDGFPRKMDQADAFEDTVARADFILYFECPEEEMLKRLLKRGETSGRVDDNLESIRKRFVTFTETSFPVIAKYETLNKVHQVSCIDTPDAVYSQVRAIFDKMFAEQKQ